MSYTSSLTHTGTPPTASDICTTPEKSSFTKWSMGMPVSWWTVRHLQAGPYWSALLIWPS